MTKFGHTLKEFHACHERTILIPFFPSSRIPRGTKEPCHPADTTNNTLRLHNVASVES